MRAVKWILGLAITLVLIVFALSNRSVTSLDLWPLPLRVEVPLFLIVLGLLAVGILIGELYAWFQFLGRREKNRGDTKRIKALESEISVLQKRIDILSSELREQESPASAVLVTQKGSHHPTS